MSHSDPRGVKPPPQGLKSAYVQIPGLGLTSQTVSLPHLKPKASSSGRSPRPPLRHAGASSARSFSIKQLHAEGSPHTLTETPRPAVHETVDEAQPADRDAGALVSYGGSASTSRPGTQGGMLSAVNVQDPRSLYIDLVVKLSGDTATFKSPALFCESLLQQTDRTRRLAEAGVTGTILPPGSVSHASPLQAAAACWALDVLAHNAGCKDVLVQIRDALYPCLFIDHGRGYANAQPHVRARFNEAEVISNPYLASDFFFEHFGEAREQVSSLTSTNSLLQGRMKSNVHSVTKTIARLCDKSLRPVFSAWRLWCRKNRVDRFAKDLMRRHGNRDTRRLMLDGTLGRWRLTVEQRRTVNLKQRVHALEYQLENTKNQFQLQCFRSDKYLRIVEELREALELWEELWVVLWEGVWEELWVVLEQTALLLRWRSRRSSRRHQTSVGCAGGVWVWCGV